MEEKNIERKVLIAEDNTFVRLALTDMISSEGVGVDSAQNGRHALELFRKNDYGLIITDLQMPDMNGIGLMRSIKAEGNGTPVVLMSGIYVQEHNWRKEGFADFMHKPIRYRPLMECLGKYLEE